LALLRGLGAELVHGDLKDRSSLDTACRGVEAVISTASSTMSRQDGDSIQTVDGRGQRDLIAAASAAGVRRFVLISFPEVPIDFPLQSAKREAEESLRQSGMIYTILQPTFFTEVWLSAALGFDVGNGKARVYGEGSNKISWISLEDVARFAAAAPETETAYNRVIKLGGPDALSPLEVVGLAERAESKPIAVERVPEEALRAQYDAATDPLEKSFAALMLYYARGEVIDMTTASRTFSLKPSKSVSAHLSQRA
jgi:NADH dehydrogenase